MVLIYVILSALVPTIAAQPAPALAPAIYNSSSTYSYLGCYNETTGLAGTNGARALNGGTSEVGKGNMTVEMCLGFCGGEAGPRYMYAGLEYSRCALLLSLSYPLF